MRGFWDMKYSLIFRFFEQIRLWVAVNSLLDRKLVIKFQTFLQMCCIRLEFVYCWYFFTTIWGCSFLCHIKRKYNNTSSKWKTTSNPTIRLWQQFQQKKRYKTRTAHLWFTDCEIQLPLAKSSRHMRIGENNRVTKKGIEVSTSIIWSEFHSLFRFRFGEKPEKGNGVNCIMFNTGMLNVGWSNLIGYAPWMIQKRNDIIWLPSLMRLANILSHSCVRAHWYKANKRHEACEMFTKRITECFLQKVNFINSILFAQSKMLNHVIDHICWIRNNKTKI